MRLVGLMLVFVDGMKLLVEMSANNFTFVYAK